MRGLGGGQEEHRERQSDVKVKVMTRKGCGGEMKPVLLAIYVETRERMRQLREKITPGVLG